jgi:rubrerythrin
MLGLARFSASEVYDMAIATEQNGRIFYEAAAAAAKTPEVQKLMKYLAQAEEHHEETFRQLREALPAPTPGSGLPETYDGEQREYLNALLKSRVLPDAETGVAAVAAMTEDAEAVRFAIGFEKDTILFMYEMQELLPPSERKSIEVLLRQEKIHVRMLQQLRL